MNDERANAWSNGKMIIIHAMKESTQGPLLLADPILRIDSHDLVELGQAVVKVLDGSRGKAPWPESWDDLFNPVLKIAGDISYKTFTRQFKCVGICRKDVIGFEPSKKYNRSGGSIPIKDKIKKMNTDDPEILGQALLDAFEECE